jgi:uncharacterized membrane protein YgcG
MRVVATLVAACVVVLLALLAPPRAAAAAGDAYPDRIGVATHLRYFDDRDIRSELARLAAGGVTWVREDFTWAQLEPRQGEMDWNYSDKVMSAAAIEGIDVLALVTASPPWASSDPSGAGDKLYPPRDPALFADFVRRLVARYGSTGEFWALRPDLPRRPLRAVEIWNEPWCRCAWKPDPDPPAYANLARQTLVAARSADPEVKLLISGDYWMSRIDPKPLRWLEALLDADPTLPALADGWNVHPYPGPRNLGPYDELHPLFAYGRVEAVHDLLVKRKAELPIWITEMGWSTGPDDPERVSEATQAIYTGGAIQRALKDWGAWVPRIFIYSWGRTGQSSGVRDFALRRADNTPRPAWDALVSLATGGGAIGGWNPDDPRATAEGGTSGGGSGGGHGGSGSGSGSSGSGSGSVRSNPPIVETVVLTPYELEALRRGERRGKRFFAQADMLRRQPSRYTAQTGAHLLIACAPECLIDGDVRFRVREKGRWRWLQVGRTRFTIPAPGRAKVFIRIWRAGQRRLLKHREVRALVTTTFYGPHGRKVTQKDRVLFRWERR